MLQIVVTSIGVCYYMLKHFLEELVIYMPTLILSVLNISVKQVGNNKM
jgi:hypothetical protein